VKSLKDKGAVCCTMESVLDWLLIIRSWNRLV